MMNADSRPKQRAEPRRNNLNVILRDGACQWLCGGADVRRCVAVMLFLFFLVWWFFLLLYTNLHSVVCSFIINIRVVVRNNIENQLKTVTLLSATRT